MKQAELIADPISWRKNIESIEKHYHNQVFNLNQLEFYENNVAIEKCEYSLSKSTMQYFDRLIKFDQVWKQISERVKFNGSEKISIDKARNDYLASSNEKIRLLFHEDSKAQLIGICQFKQEFILPTKVSLWLSLLASKINLKLELKSSVEEIYSNFNIEVYQESQYFEPLPGDIIKSYVKVNYDLSKSTNFHLQNNFLRLVCENGTLSNSLVSKMNVPYNHDAGARRVSLERLVEKQLLELKTNVDTITYLTNTSYQNLYDLMENWLAMNIRQPIIRKAILIELAEKYKDKTLYDAFNAITSARHRLSNNENNYDQHLKILSGRFLADAKKF